MIERIVSQIITELGPTGLLVIGLYFALAVPLNKIAKAIEQVNKDNIPTKEVLTSCTEKIVEAIHGQN